MPTSWIDRAAALLLCLLAALPADAAVQAFARKQIGDQLRSGGNYALVIGISQFTNRAWGTLDGVAPEVAEVAGALETQHHFTIVAPGHGGGPRMTKAQLRRAIAGFVETYGKPGNRLVVYIASHGYRDLADPQGQGYVIASDSLAPGRDGFADTAYSVAELEVDLARNEARHVFLLVNTCFSGSLIPITRKRGAAEEAFGREPAALSDEVLRWMGRNLARTARVVLTAGDGAQEVPDDGEYWRAVVDGLGGAADGNHDGLILGTELAAYVKGRVGPRTLAIGVANDPIFAQLPGDPGAAEASGEFVFLSPLPPSPAAAAGISQAEEVLAARRSRLVEREFTECADCPVMVELPPVIAADGAQRRIALARTETTYAQWDACYRDLGCGRYIQDDGQGRGDRPVAGITWRDALEFEAWLGAKRRDRCTAYRLPTREEWLAGAGLAEVAAALAQPGDPLALPDVAEPGNAVCRDCGQQEATEAARTASLPANALGLHDMQGNLWEWVRPQGDTCRIGEERCAGDGTVMGGSFATRADALSHAVLAGGTLPRTGNRRPYSVATVGLRMACEMKAAPGTQ